MTIYNKIELYKNRNFSALWDDTISLVKNNFKQIIVLFLVFVLPANIVITIFSKGFTNILTNYYMQGNEEYNSRYYSMFDNYHLVIATYFSSSIFNFFRLSWTSFVMFSFIKYYEENRDITSTTIYDFFLLLKSNLLKFVLITAFLFTIIFLINGSIYLIAFKQIYILLILIILILGPAYLFFMGAYYLIYPNYLLEDVDIIQAISNAISINNKAWSSIFMFLLVLSIFSAIFIQLFTIPTLLTTYMLPYFITNISSAYMYILNIINSGFVVLSITFSSIFMTVGYYLIYYSFSDHGKLTIINKLIESIDKNEN